MNVITAVGIRTVGSVFSRIGYPLGQSDWMADHWPQILWWIVPIVALIAAFYLWNITLRREVQRRTDDLPADQAAEQVKHLFANPVGFVQRIEEIIAVRKPVLNEKLPLRDDRTLARDYVPLRIDGDEVEHLWHYRDITESKHVEDALHQSETKYRRLFMNAPVGIIIADTQGNVTSANPAVLTLLGSPSEEATKAINVLTFPPLVKAGVSDAIRRCLTGEELVMEYPYMSAWGKEVFARLHLTPIFDEAGQVDSVLGIIEDITDRRQAEEALRQSEAKYRYLADEILDGVSVTVDGKNYWVNNAFADIFGYSKAELIGQDVDFVIVPEEVPRLLRQMRHRLAGEYAPDQYTTRAKRKDGKLIDLDVSAKVIQFEGRQAIQVVVRDVTAQKVLERQLIQQERMAAVGQLTAGIAHDFNNILASMMGYTELIQLSPETPAALQPDLERIITSGERAVHLVRQLLDFSRKSMHQPKQLNLADFTGKGVEFLKRTLPETIQISLVCPDNGDTMVEADPDQLHQVLTNLAINARDAMPTGGRLTVNVSRVSDAKANCLSCGKAISGEWICLAVTDTGHGISPDVLTHILEPFFTTREVGQGTGLGLSQVSGIIGQNQGHMSIESEPERGTTVHIYLPPAANGAAAEAATAPNISHLKRGQGQTVLLVEDDPIVREVNQVMLERLNYRALVAANGREALAIFADHKDDIALVLSDMVMPDMGGEALFHNLKKQNPRIKMVIMSGYPLDEADIESLLEAGIAAWAEKPLSLSKMAQTVGNVIPPKRKGRWA